MRGALLLALTFSATVSSQIVVPLYRGYRGQSHSPSPPSLQPQDPNQRPIMAPNGPGPVIPPHDPSSDDPSDGGSGSVMLSDVMGRDRSINIFAGLARDIESVSQRLDDSSKNSTVLAPLNSAIEKLPRKPWEDPRDYDVLGANAYAGDDGQERAQRNLRRFVEAHVIPQSPWRAGEKIKAIGDDQDLWWEDKGDGTKVIQPGHIEVVSVASTVANGEVWILKAARNYS